MKMSGGTLLNARRSSGRGVAGADADPDVGHRQAEALRGLADAGQRAAQVALHVDRERLERADVQHPAPPPGLLGRRGGGQPVQRPQEGRQRLARAGRRDDEGVAAAADRLPGALLRGRGGREGPGEPRPGRGGEAVEGGHAPHAAPGVRQAPAGAAVSRASRPPAGPGGRAAPRRRRTRRRRARCCSTAAAPSVFAVKTSWNGPATSLENEHDPAHEDVVGVGRQRGAQDGQHDDGREQQEDQARDLQDDAEHLPGPVAGRGPAARLGPDRCRRGVRARARGRRCGGRAGARAARSGQDGTVRRTRARRGCGGPRAAARGQCPPVGRASTCCPPGRCGALAAGTMAPCPTAPQRTPPRTPATGRPTPSSPTAAPSTCGRSRRTTRDRLRRLPRPAVARTRSTTASSRWCGRCPPATSSASPPSTTTSGRRWSRCCATRSSGSCRYARFAGTADAEVAVVVEDAHQGRGLGALLLEHLEAAARSAASSASSPTCCRSNRRMLAVFRAPASRSPADGRRLRRADLPDPGDAGVARGRPRPRAPGRGAQRARSCSRRGRSRSSAPRREPGTAGHEVFRSLLAHGFERAGLPGQPGGAARAVGARLRRRARRARTTSTSPSSPCRPRRCSDGRAGLLGEARPRARRRVRRLRRRRGGGPRPAGRGGAAGPRGRDAPDRARTRWASSTPTRPYRLHATFATGVAAARPGRRLQPVRRAGRHLPRRGRPALPRAVDVRLDRRPRRRLGQRPAAVLAGRRRHRRRAHAPAGLRQPPQVRAHRAGRSGAASRWWRSRAAAARATSRSTRCSRSAGVVRVDTLAQLFEAGQLLALQPLPARPPRRHRRDLERAGRARRRRLPLAGLRGARAARRRAGGAAGARRHHRDRQPGRPRPAGRARAAAGRAAAGRATAARSTRCSRSSRRTPTQAGLAAVLLERRCRAAAAGAGVLPRRRRRPRRSSPSGGGRAGRGSVPSYASPESAALALARAAGTPPWRARPQGEVPELTGVDGEAAPRRVAAGHAARRRRGCRRRRGRPARRGRRRGLADDAARPTVDEPRSPAAEQHGWPVVLKSADARWRNRADVGAVQLGLDGARRAARGLGGASTALIGGGDVLVQPMAPPGRLDRRPAGRRPRGRAAGVAAARRRRRGPARRPAHPHAPAHRPRRRATWSPASAAPRCSTGTDIAAPCRTLLLRVARLAEEVPEVAEVLLDPVLVGRAGSSCCTPGCGCCRPGVDPERGPRRLVGRGAAHLR